MQIDDVRVFLAIAAAMVLAHIVLLKWVGRARPGWLKRWLVVSLVLGVTGTMVGGLLTGQFLLFGIILIALTPVFVADSELRAWQQAAQRRKLESLQEQEDLTLSPFLQARATKKQ